ncbi:acyl-CoA N-acyltransferase [Trichoderma sp. SZMC 28012]
MDPNKLHFDSVRIRTHRPGDMGMVIYRHALLYATEYGCDERFEALVARVTADFIDHYDETKDRCWIAEVSDTGEFLGSIMLVEDRSSTSAKTAKLRLLLVEDRARGIGLGKKLVKQSIDFAKKSGYDRIELWTQSVLTGARRLYEAEGFQLVRVGDGHESWKGPGTAEIWELKL